MSTSFSCRMKIVTTLSPTYEETEGDTCPRAFLVITEKGKKVAERLRAIQEILEELINGRFR